MLSSGVSLAKNSLTNQSTRIATARFYEGYMLVKKWVIVASLACPQSRDFKRYMNKSKEKDSKHGRDAVFFYGHSQERLF